MPDARHRLLPADARAQPVPGAGSMTPPQVAEAVFDSHRFVKRLTEAGMEEGLAEVLAEEHMSPWIRNVATKTDVAAIRADLEDTEADIRRDLENFEANIRRDLENIEANIRRDTATKTEIAMIRKDLENFEANIRRDAATKTEIAMIRKDLENFEANIRRDAATKTEIAMVRTDLEHLRRNAATKADVANAVAAAERRLMIAIIGVAGVLFAALRLTQ